MKPQFWLLYVGLGGYALVALAHIVNPMIKEYDRNRPRTHFYSEVAWKDCGSMMAEAKTRGFDAWTCHDPSMTISE